MKSFWTLNKLLALGVLVAFALLLLELRFDHRHVLGEHWQAFVPLIYSGAMIVLGGVALGLWQRGGRTFLFWGFSLALAVGVVGFWMHNEDAPQESVGRVLSAWSQPVEHEEHHHEEAALQAPPVLAPLAFAGLGLLGMLSCARRFQPDAESK
jgi:hypothetical protein